MKTKVGRMPGLVWPCVTCLGLLPSPLSAQVAKLRDTLIGHRDGVTCVAFSPDGKRIVSGSYDKTARVWDAQTGQQLLKLEGHTARVLSVAFSPDGKRIFAWDVQDKALAWSAADGKPTAPVDAPPIPLPGSTFARALETRRSLQDLDVMASEFYRTNPRTRAMVDLGGVRTILTVPLCMDAAVLGLITVYRQEVRAFSDQQILGTVVLSRWTPARQA